MEERHLFLDFLAKLLGTDQGWAWLSAQPAFHQGIMLGSLVVGAVAVVIALVLLRVGIFMGFRQFKTAIATALRAFRDETVERERTYQALLSLKDAASNEQLDKLNAELAEATEARRTYEDLSARTTTILTRKRWLVVAPRQDDLLLDEVRLERDRYLQATSKLSHSLRKVVARMAGMPEALRDEAQEVLADLPAAPDAQGRSA